MANRTVYEFGGFRFEPFNIRLIYRDRSIPLSARAAETLLVLVRQPDVLVTKEALMAEVWPGLSVEENNLNQQISLLRKALAEDGGTRFIETVRGSGFRFQGSVRAFELDQCGSNGTSSNAGSGNGSSSLAHQELGRSATAAAVPSAGTRDAASALDSRRPGGTRLRSAVAIAGAVLVLAAVTVYGLGWLERADVARESKEAEARGKELLDQDDARGAVVELQRAIRIDAGNATAHAALAHALDKQSWHDSLSRPAGRSPSVEVAERAVALDPRCGGCQGTLGFFLFYHAWEWDRAERHLHEAIRLAPDQESIRPAYAMLLAATGRTGEALSQIDVALEKRPYQVTWRTIRATILYLERRYADAVAEADRALALDEDARHAWEWRSKALFQMGRGAEAIKALAQEAFAIHSSDLDATVQREGVVGGLQRLLEITGDWRGRAEQCWRRAAWRALLGDADGALIELETAYEQRNVNLIYTALDPAYDSIREHPRFQRVLAQMGLGAGEAGNSRRAVHAGR